MRVAWDARVLCHPEQRGMGTYAVNLLTALRDVRPDLELLLFHDSDHRASAHAGVTMRRIGPIRGYRWQLWERLGLPFHAFISRSDVLHSVANTTPPRSMTPRVVTVHDVIPYLPGIADETPTLPYFTRAVPAAVRRADAIITDSECSRQDIHRVFGISVDRIAVVPLAVDPAFRPPDELERATILSALGVGQPYVLAHAAVSRRKNTVGVLRAFRHIAKRNAEVRLVLTGVGPALEPLVRRAMAEAGVPDERVLLTRFVERSALATLYAEAEAFLFLSLYEGFGLPILEAMKCGAPVVCSTRASCPEIAGNAAVRVDPDDPSAVADAALAVMGRSREEARAWRQRGWAREREFDWKRTAMTTLGIYDAVAGS